MDHGVGIAEAGEEFPIEIDLCHHLRGDGVAHHQIFREDRELAHLVGDAELVEHAEHIRAELDARADLAKLRRLFEQQCAEALAGQRQSAGEPANAAADDDIGMILFRHGPLRD